MAYECQNFKNGQILTADCLNKMDEWLQYICGREVVSVVINEKNELLIMFCNGDVINAGKVGTGGGGSIDPEEILSVVEAALAEAKASGEFDGKDGTSVTVERVTESTASGGTNTVEFSDGNILKIKNGLNGSKGESVSINAYRVGDEFTTIVFTDGTTIQIPNGTSVTVDEVSESDADGGENIVTFSDGKSLTVKNGSKGSPGVGIKSVEFTSGGRLKITTTDGMTTVSDSLQGAPGVAGVGITAIHYNEAVGKLTIVLSDGTSFTTADIRGEKGETGKTAYEYAKDGGYSGSESEFAAKLAKEPLVGTTSKITPMMVGEALVEGRPVCLIHNDPEFGYVTVNYFAASAVEGVIMASGIIPTSGGELLLSYSLIGVLDNNSWTSMARVLAEANKIPVTLPNPEFLTINGTSYNGEEPVTIDTTVRAAFTYYANHPVTGTERVMCDIAPSELIGSMAKQTVIAELTTDGGAYIGSAVFGKISTVPAKVVADIITAKGIYRITGDSTNAGYSVEVIPLTASDGGIIIFEEKTITSSMVSSLAFQLDTVYDIYWNGILYTCTSYKSEGEVYTGNGHIINSNLPDTGEPFLFTHMVGASSCMLHKATGQASSNTLMVTTHGYKVGGGAETPYIVGDSKTLGEWTGTCEAITEYYDGLAILYKTNVQTAVSDYTTLNINGLGAAKVVKGNGSKFFAVSGNVFYLVYNVDKWVMPSTDSDSVGTVKAASVNTHADTLYFIGVTTCGTQEQYPHVTAQAYLTPEGYLYNHGSRVVTESTLPRPLLLPTDQYTPSQMLESGLGGKIIYIMHMDNDLGIFIFSSFAFDYIANTIICSTNIINNGVPTLLRLVGDTTNDTWQMSAIPLAIYDGGANQ